MKEKQQSQTIKNIIIFPKNSQLHENTIKRHKKNTAEGCNFIETEEKFFVSKALISSQKIISQ